MKVAKYAVLPQNQQAKILLKLFEQSEEGIFHTAFGGYVFFVTNSYLLTF